MRLLLKMFLVLGMTIAILVPLLMIRGTIDERQEYRNQAVASIAGSYAGAQAFAGPVLVVPYTETVQAEEKDDKGVVRPAILSAILPLAYERIPVLIDPKLRNFNSYRPATLVTPNHFEALRMSDSEDTSDDGSHQAAKVIREKLGCDAVLITRGDRGMMLLEADGEPVYVETAAREVYDVTGAGDTVIAALAGALSAGSTMLEAAALANHAAGIVVGKVGTATASAEELLRTFDK